MGLPMGGEGHLGPPYREKVGEDENRVANRALGLCYRFVENEGEFQKLDLHSSLGMCPES